LDSDLFVSPPIIEKQGQPINGQLLKEISQVTRGANYSVDDFGKVIEQISLLPQPQPIEKRMRLWSEPAWGGIILFLLTTYWVGRKWVGLV